MLTLFDYLPSQNAYKIRLLLNHLNRAYKTEVISIFEGEGKTENFKKISPTGVVPAIRLTNGECLAESNAILLYLAEGTQYLPNDTFARAKIYQWLFFEGETVQSGIATLRHWILTGKDKNRTSDIMEAKRNLSHTALQILNTELGKNEFLGGASYTIADMANFAYVHRAEDAKLPLQDYPNVVNWIERVKVQEGFLDTIYPYSIDPYSYREL